MRKFNNQANISGEIIEKVRTEKNISREQLARERQLKGINADRVFIYRIEKNKKVLKDFELVIIAEILDIDLNSLKEKVKA